MRNPPLSLRFASMIKSWTVQSWILRKTKLGATLPPKFHHLCIMHLYEWHPHNLGSGILPTNSDFQYRKQIQHITSLEGAQLYICTRIHISSVSGFATEVSHKKLVYGTLDSSFSNNFGSCSCRRTIEQIRRINRAGHIYETFRESSFEKQAAVVGTFLSRIGSDNYSVLYRCSYRSSATGLLFRQQPTTQFTFDLQAASLSVGFPSLDSCWYKLQHFDMITLARHTDRAIYTQVHRATIRYPTEDTTGLGH